MRFGDLLNLVLYNLGRRKGRVALTTLGVIIGTAAVILLVSLGLGLQRNATSQLWGISDLRRIEVYPNYGGGEGGPVAVAIGPGAIGSSSPSGQKLLTPAAIEEIRALEGVEYVIPRNWVGVGAVLKVGRLENYPSLLAVDTDDLAIFDYPLEAGTTRLERGTAIIGSWAARQFYDPRQRPGQEPPPQPDLLNQQVRLVLQKWTQDGQMVTKTVNLRIVGILAESRSEADGALFVRMDEATAWEEWARGQRINRNREGYNMLIVRARDPDRVLELADQINAMGYMASTPQSFVQGINNFYLVLQLIFGGVGAIALLVAAIGIANTMTMAILERTREIGLMKALGATNRDVLSIFLGEAAGIGFLGGLGGVLIGWLGSAMLNVVAITYLASQSQGGPPPTTATFTPLWLPLFALAFATLIGLISGLYPALRAATLVPVNALKYE